MLIAVAPAAAKGRPDLTVTSLSSVPAQVAPGGSFAATAKVKSLGATAKGSKVAFLLSRDPKLGRGDLRLAVARVAKLQHSKTASSKKQLRVPSSASGQYRLLACADIAGQLKELKEGNNCRASKGRLRVTATAANGTGPSQPQQTPGQPQQDPPQPPPSSGSFPMPANPLKVTYGLESGFAVSEFIPTSGGQLTTEDSEGTVYTLTFPFDSLFNDTKVTMTPLSSIGGAPMSGGLAGGVKLEPEGLTLNEPATLTITPEGDAPPLGAQTGFLAQGDGEDFHLYPLAFGPDLQLELLHFTIAGAGSATATDRQTAAERTPVTNLAQYEAAIAERLRLAREREESGTPDGDWQSDLEPVHIAYYKDVVKPTMERALTDDAAYDEALREALGWQRKIELYGHGPSFDPLRDELFELLGHILENALNRANSKCVNEHELRAIRRIAQIARTADMLGFDLGPGLELVVNCLRFEVDLDSRLTLGDAVFHVAAPNILLEAELQDNRLIFVGARGEGDLSWLEFDSFAEYETECPYPNEGSFVHGTIKDAGADGSRTVAALSFNLSPLQEGTTPPTDDTFGATLHFDTNEPTEHYSITETGACANSGVIDGFNWEQKWATLLMIKPSPLYEVFKQGAPGEFSNPLTTFTKVQRGAGGPADPLLHVTLNDSMPGFSEQMTVEVFHRPLS